MISRVPVAGIMRDQMAECGFHDSLMSVLRLPFLIKLLSSDSYHLCKSISLQSQGADRLV